MINTKTNKFKKIQLSELGTLIMGQSPIGSSYNLNKMGVPLLNGASDFEDNKIIPNQFTSKPTKLAKKEDILFCIRATIGKITLSDDTYCLGRGVAGFRANEEIVDKKFLMKFLDIALQHLVVQGTTIKGVRKEDLEKIEVLLPSIQIQQKIISILEKAEKLKEMRKEADELTKDFLKAIFLEMFGDPVKNPQKYAYKTLEEISAKITDGEHLNPTITKEGKHIIMAKDVIENGVDFSQNNFVSEEDFLKFTKKCNPQQGDLLLVSRGATIGRCTSVHAEKLFCLMGSVILIKPKSINVRYLEYLFKDTNFIKNVVNVSGASAQQAIYLINLKKLKIPIPPIKLQEQFSLIVEKITHTKQYQKQTKESIDNLLNYLMQKAFKGEIVC